MEKKDEHDVNQLNMLRNNIKDKLRAMKNTSLQIHRESEIKYKPLLDPIKNLSEKLLDKQKTIETPKQQPEPEREPFSESDAESEESTAVPRRSLGPGLDAFIRDNKISEKLGDYLRFIETDTNDEADLTYGIYFDGERWKMGTTPVKFYKDVIVIGEKKIKGSLGLFELIFKKQPDETSYTKTDLDVYKHMLESTNAHKRKDGSRIKANGGYKYTNIISKIFPPKRKTQHASDSESSVYRLEYSPISGAPEDYPSLNMPSLNEELPSHSASKPADKINKRKKLGEGLMMQVAKSKVDYMYWNDPNELVDRLRLLMASKEAGNTSHNNEIVAILEELKEANIIEHFDNVEL